MNRKTTLLILFLLVAISLVIILSWNKRKGTEVTPATSSIVVSVGYLPHHGYLPLFVALDKGMFAKRSVRVNAIRFDSSPLMGTAFVNQEIDAVPISTSVALGIESRDPGRFRIFAVSSETKEGYLTALVSMPGSAIERVEDLKGKKLGCFPGPAALTLFGLVLKRHGLSPGRDVTLIELAPPTQIQALVSHQVDALATYEPIATQAVMDYKANKFLPAAVESQVLEPTQGGVWLISNLLLREEPAISRDFVAAIYDAIDFIRANPHEAKQSIGRYTNVRSVVAAQLPMIPFTKVGEIDVRALQRHADIMTDSKVLSKRIAVAPLLLSGKGASATEQEGR